MKCNQPQKHMSLTLPPRRDLRSKPEKLSNYESSSPRASVKEVLTLPPLSVPELNKETSGCPALWGCSMVCIGKNIPNCSKKPNFFLPCARCAGAVHTHPHMVAKYPLLHSLLRGYPPKKN